MLLGDGVLSYRRGTYFFVLRPTDWPYGEVSPVFAFEVSSKCASGEPEIVPNRDLDLGRKEGKSMELKREVSQRASNHFAIGPVFSTGVSLGQIFQWQYYDFY